MKTHSWCFTIREADGTIRYTEGGYADFPTASAVGSHVCRELYPGLRLSVSRQDAPPAAAKPVAAKPGPKRTVLADSMLLRTHVRDGLFIREYEHYVRMSCLHAMPVKGGTLMRPHRADSPHALSPAKYGGLDRHEQPANDFYWITLN